MDVLLLARNPDFWAGLDRLVRERRIVIDRPRGSRHPRFPDLVYPLDYGYLEGTRAADGSETDVWRGTAAGQRVDGIACTVDLGKMDAEVKLLVSCTREEMETVHRVHNEAGMHAIVVAREQATALSAGAARHPGG